MYKLPSFRFFVVCFLISAISGAFLLLESCHTKQGGTCTYEGLECPNALNQYLTDSIAIAQRDAAYLSLEDAADSLMNRVTELETQLAGCELQNHSHIKHDK